MIFNIFNRYIPPETNGHVQKSMKRERGGRGGGRQILNEIRIVNNVRS